MTTTTTVIAIVGPTATGKSDLAIALAEALHAEVVNADSRQVYRGMDIGTGKPSLSDRQRRPHHLFDLVEPDDPFSLAVYLDAAKEAIEAIHARNAPTIVVGGTGQYIWALLEGWTIPRVPPNDALRAELEERVARIGPQALHAELAATDPAAAKAIHPNNVRRTIRALEVIRATGQLFSELRTAVTPPWKVRILGLTMERETLYQRVDSRIASQIENGWPEEVRHLLECGHGPELPSFASLGYREMASHVRGDVSLEDTQERIKTLTRRFARHQYAWFPLSDQRIHWLQTTEQPIKESLALLGGA